MKHTILVALGEGGHTKEMLTLVDMLGDDYAYAYIIVADDPISEKKIRRPGPVYRVQRPRDKEHHLLRDAAKFVRRSREVLLPVVVLSLGALVLLQALAVFTPLMNFVWALTP